MAVGSSYMRIIYTNITSAASSMGWSRLDLEAMDLADDLDRCGQDRVNRRPTRVLYNLLQRSTGQSHWRVG